MTDAHTPYCDSCQNAAQDEAGFTLDDFSLGAILGDLGADIADHLCDAQETGEECICACSRERRRKLRPAAIAAQAAVANIPSGGNANHAPIQPALPGPSLAA